MHRVGDITRPVKLPSRISFIAEYDLHGRNDCSKRSSIALEIVTYLSAELRSKTVVLMTRFEQITFFLSCNFFPQQSAGNFFRSLTTDRRGSFQHL